MVTSSVIHPILHPPICSLYKTIHLVIPTYLSIHLSIPSANHAASQSSSNSQPSNQSPNQPSTHPPNYITIYSSICPNVYLTVIPILFPSFLPSHLSRESNLRQHSLCGLIPSSLLCARFWGYRDETNRTCPQGAQSLVGESVSSLVMTSYPSEILAPTLQAPSHLPSPPTWIHQPTANPGFHQHG